MIGYTYAEDERENGLFRSGVQDRSQRRLRKAIPKLPLVDFVDASADGNKLLIIRRRATSDPGRYYLFDRKAEDAR